MKPLYVVIEAFRIGCFHFLLFLQRSDRLVSIALQKLRFEGTLRQGLMVFLADLQHVVMEADILAAQGVQDSRGWRELSIPDQCQLMLRRRRVTLMTGRFVQHFSAGLHSFT